MKNLSFLELNEKEFKELENNFSNSNYYQTTAWGNLKEITGWKKKFIGVFDGKEYKAITMLLYKNIIFNKKIFYAPRGILTNYDDYGILDYFTIEIKKYLKKQNGFILKIDPLILYCDRDLNGEIVGEKNNQELVNHLKQIGYKHKDFTIGFSNEIQYRWSFYLNTLKTEEEIIKNMNNRCKRNLKKSSKYPCIIKEADEDSFIDFKNIMEHTCNRHRCFDRSLEYYKQIKTVFNDKAKILIAYLDRDEYLKNFKTDKLYEIIKKENKKYIPISAGIFIIDKQGVHYVYGGTYKHYMHFGFQYKLQYLMIKLTKENNLSIYDFGGISGNLNPNSKNYGIYDFKRGFGGYVVEYIGEYDLIINKWIYAIYKIIFSFYKTLKKFNYKTTSLKDLKINDYKKYY